MYCMVVTIEVSHCEISLLKEVAEVNICCMVVTFEVSHCETSSLKEVAEENICSMPVALEVSHVEIYPYLASAMVALLSHSSTAPESVSSSNEDTADRVGAGVGGQSAEPLLLVNIFVVVIDETSQHRS